jgi:hypothetical protein
MGRASEEVGVDVSLPDERVSDGISTIEGIKIREEALMIPYAVPQLTTARQFVLGTHNPRVQTDMLEASASQCGRVSHRSQRGLG